MAKDRLQQKRIVVIGGTTGMGLSAAHAFVSEGARVVVVGRDPDNAAKAAEELKGCGVVLTVDATEEGTAEKAIQTCVDHFGGLDGLYHVAGGSGRRMGDGPLHEIFLEGWQYTLELNLTSLMLSNRAAIRYFLEQGSPGVLLNMSSVLGFSPSPVHFSTHAYAAAKAAVIGFSKSVAAFYAPKNIRVNVVAPALVETPMSQRAAGDRGIQQFIKTKQPLDGGRIGLPQDVDGAAVFLLSDEARFITGQVVAVDGGWSVSEGQY
jgi:NAD(P)-dependent dehydrogenase (short-subunit alcohol dehydrogenase family)